MIFLSFAWLSCDRVWLWNYNRFRVLHAVDSLNVKDELQLKKVKPFCIMQTFSKDISWFATWKSCSTFCMNWSKVIVTYWTALTAGRFRHYWRSYDIYSTWWLIGWNWGCQIDFVFKIVLLFPGCLQAPQQWCWAGVVPFVLFLIQPTNPKSGNTINGKQRKKGMA